ncbi:helix-turn-helix domain-containing protein [Niabella beijingensis]|uniref:helix-turn-helix domain-containing protein n=1 Tax=Niabella beijingensis TaxID=2872700 RepID=UPI001CBD604B|nr:AraC family transcriptional regulator [Niabella beijingensis]MBZ4187809.1 AraC family transcriptional regulator [Niabella beijingensis]
MLRIQEYNPAPQLRSFIKKVYHFEEKEALQTILPFYPDGYPGIIYHTASDGLYSLKNKKLTPFFLYGQTLTPIELRMGSPFTMLIYQLYPSVAYDLFGLDPAMINDDCYNLEHLISPAAFLRLKEAAQPEQQTDIINDFLLHYGNSTHAINHQLLQAIKYIIDRNGNVKIKDASAEAYLTERTFQRQFLTRVGITPKQFALIIQFQNSVADMGGKDLGALTHVALENGFNDQSHFIRIIKKYSGKTPRALIHMQPILL